MSETIERINYFLEGLNKANSMVGTVVQSFVFTFSQMLNGVRSELADLQTVLMYQAGQVSKSQLNLSTASITELADLPMTLMRLQEVL